MNKTLQALDELFFSIITLLPSWLGMLRSTRTLTAIGTAVAVYYTATQAGLPTDQAVIAAIVEAVTGVSLIVGKTIRSGVPQNGQTTSQPVTTSTVSKPLSTSPPAPVYATPPILQDIGANESTTYLKWLVFDEMLDWNLTKHVLQIRLEYAMDILKEDKRRLDIAWLEELERTKASETIIPTSQDFESYETTEALKKQIMDMTLGCEWLSINQDTMLRGYKGYFNGLLWVSRLFDKNVNWQLVHTVNEIAEHNYNAVI
jgi:hypothetical protein